MDVSSTLFLAFRRNNNCSMYSLSMNTSSLPVISTLNGTRIIRKFLNPFLILMIVVPEAKTPLERMQMMGEEPTVKNIGKTVTDNFRDDNTSASPQKTAQPSSFAATTTTVLGILANILLMIGLVLAVMVLISLVFGFIGCLFALIMFGTSWGGTLILPIPSCLTL